MKIDKNETGQVDPVEAVDAPVEVVDAPVKGKSGETVVIVSNGDSWRSLAEAHAPKGAKLNAFAAMLCEANLCVPLREGTRVIIPGGK